MVQGMDWVVLITLPIFLFELILFLLILKIPVEEMTSVAGIEGFVVKPEYAKKSRGQQFFFVNRRFIKSPFLHHAICNAFEGSRQQSLLKNNY